MITYSTEFMHQSLAQHSLRIRALQLAQAEHSRRQRDAKPSEAKKIQKKLDLVLQLKKTFLNLRCFLTVWCTQRLFNQEGGFAARLQKPSILRGNMLIEQLLLF